MKVSSLLIVLTLLFSLSSACAKYSGGTGTATTPYQIGSVEDLQLLGDSPADYAAHFVLIADIDLAALTFHRAVIAPDTSSNNGFQGTQFTGVFDGAGFTISTLHIARPWDYSENYHGLFGNVSATGEIKNLHIESVDITAGAPTGGIAALCAGTITNSHVTGTVSAWADYRGAIGGVAGSLDHGLIQNCYADINVYGKDDCISLGGLVGTASESDILKCQTSGAVEIQSNRYAENVGGLVGRAQETNIAECCSFCFVDGGWGSRSVGGLVGYFTSSTKKISNCYATGTILAGYGASNTGGLVGHLFYGQVEKCYAIGDVEAGPYDIHLGMLIGYSYGSTVLDSFRPVTSEGNSVGTPLTAEEFCQRGSFTSTGWDFVGETTNGTADLWDIRENYAPPRMAHQQCLPGDFIGRYIVDVADYAVMASAWLSSTADANWNANCDLNSSSVIDLPDLIIMINNWLEQS